MKKIMILISLLLVLGPLTAQAHTALTDSNPAAGETLAEQPEEIELAFGTEIEEGSSMELQGPNGVVEIDEITLAGNVMLGSLANELENGQYTISWKIIGADGHPIEGEVPFSVQIAAEAEEPAAEESTDQPQTEQPATEQPADNETAAAESGEENGFLTIGLIVLLVVLAGAAILLLVKKKR